MHKLLWLLALVAFNGTAADLVPGSRLNPVIETDMLKLLDLRKGEQIREAQGLQSFHEFSFTDQFERSGITFTNHIVEDALKHFKPAHYDHGTGLALADIDGDGLIDILFVNQIGGNQLWRNKGDCQFENITDRAGIALADRICVSASFADIDNDGDPDLFITTVRTGNALFENLGDGKFREISQDAGLDYVGHSSGAVFFDVNNDGLLDLFVCNVGRYTTDEKGLGGYFRALPDAFQGHLKPDRRERSLLYINLGNRRFKEASAEFKLLDEGWNGDATFCDVNRDGFPDIYVLNMQGDNHLYLNRGGKFFEERTETYFPQTPWGAMGIKFFDFNQDGLLDLYITDMHSDMTGLQTKLSKNLFTTAFEQEKSEQWCTAEHTAQYLQNPNNNIFGNAFYLAQKEGGFREVSAAIGAETLWPWGVSVGDINADGYPDVFVTAGMGFGFRYAINSLLLNEQGRRFAGCEFVLGVEPRADQRLSKTGFVLECSGADKDHPICRGRTGTVPVSEVLSSRSSVLFDVDNDGDLDLIINEMDHRPQVLISNLTEKRRVSRLALRLHGTTSNRDGLGAFVTVTASGRSFYQQHDGKSGYLSQSSLPLYFGLGDAEKIEKVEITWPSGIKQTLTTVPINQKLIATEPSVRP